MWHHTAPHTPSCGSVVTRAYHIIEVGHQNMSAVEPPPSRAAAAPVPREFYYFVVTCYFSLFLVCMMRVCLTGERWICHWWQLCIAFTFLVFSFSFFIYIYILNKHMCAETRSGNDVVILSCSCA